MQDLLKSSWYQWIKNKNGRKNVYKISFHLKHGIPKNNTDQTLVSKLKLSVHNAFLGQWNLLHLFVLIIQVVQDEQGKIWLLHLVLLV